MFIISRTVDYPYDLLLLADPCREILDGYLYGSDCFVANIDDVPIGVIVIQKQENGLAEIMSLAVSEKWQRKRVAIRLLEYVFTEWVPLNGIRRLKVCTGNSGASAFMLYQRAGFDLKDIDRDYFVRVYPEPIWENGVQCRHRLVFEKSF